MKTNFGNLFMIVFFIQVQGGLRLPLTGLAPPRVLMCSASMGAEGSVTLQLREAVQAPDSGSSIDGSLTIGYPDPEMLADMLGSIQAAGKNDYNALLFEKVFKTGSFEAGEVTSFDILDNRENDITNAVLNKSSTTVQTSGSCDTGKCQYVQDKSIFIEQNEQCDSVFRTIDYAILSTVQPAFKEKMFAIRFCSNENLLFSRK